ncbi:iron complex transport system substrate-binding protein [Filimonas zeae]|uniref:Cobalamin-binding protein n=1 Tax=Filimonas zeae TaxID=1737353 RepID=A0A917IM08_9BACT|nr:ABC transporter substrate-binding protein [Filimonas zeae]MDR6337185.1 iron complex transport system substrate-binding protein [Filimonas zeae]GGH57392.1 cobalamin-binding protein [Filimonas zeae]
MIASSFLPAATQMIYDMGLQHLLQGITFECPPQALTEKEKVVRCVLEGKQYSSQEIDRIFSASKAQGKSLYYVDDALLQSIAPDVIFTQDVCEVCQIDTACTAAAVARLAKQPQLVALTPNTLNDVLQTAVTIATALGQEEAAYSYLSGLQQRMDAVTDTLRKHRAPLKRVMIMEWMEPIYNCGHWIPYQVAYAGGVDMLSNPGGDSIVTPWEKVVRYNPEVLVIAPCGFTTARTREELYLLTQKKEWANLTAVQNNAVFLADYDLFTQPSAGTLVDGIELLAALFHPEIFTVPAHLQSKYALPEQMGELIHAR